MIYPNEVREILRRANIGLNEVSLLMGKSMKLMSVELCVCERKAMPLTHKSSKAFIAVLNQGICNQVLGRDLYQLINEKVFFKAHQVNKFLSILGISGLAISRSMGLNDKTFYMNLRNNKGFPLKMILELYKYYPDELDLVLTKTQRGRVVWMPPKNKNPYL